MGKKVEMIVVIKVEERQYDEKKKAISNITWNTFGGVQKLEIDMEIEEDNIGVERMKDTDIWSFRQDL